MKSKIKIVSMTNNRIRIKIYSTKKEGIESLYRIRDIYSDYKLITSLKVNTCNRSITLYHNNKEEEIEERLELNEIKYIKFIKRNPKERLPYMREELKKKLTRLDKKIKNFTDGEMDLDTVVGIAFMGLSGYQILRHGRILPPVEEMLAKGLRHFMKERSYLE